MLRNHWMLDFYLLLQLLLRSQGALQLTLWNLKETTLLTLWAQVRSDPTRLTPDAVPPATNTNIQGGKTTEARKTSLLIRGAFRERSWSKGRNVKISKQKPPLKWSRQAGRENSHTSFNAHCWPQREVSCISGRKWYYITTSAGGTEDSSLSSNSSTGGSLRTQPRVTLLPTFRFLQWALHLPNEEVH